MGVQRFVVHGSAREGCDQGPAPESLQGRVDLQAFSARPPAMALAQLAGLAVKELECASLGSERLLHCHR